MPVHCPICRNPNPDDVQTCVYCETSLARFGSDGMLNPGTVLKGRYKICEIIKSGGMGVVYRGEDIETHNIIAIKQLFIDTVSAENDDVVARFEKEAKLLGRLSHTNLPSVIDYFEDNYDYFIVMDYIEGTDLEGILQQQGKPGLSEKKVVEWTLQICDVLDYLHNHDPLILYRDIKPANIVIRKSDNRAILIDFGVAKSLEDGITSGKTTIGTVGYSPPEQYKGKQKPQSDIYALGATMHHLLTGKFPEIPFTFDPICTLNPEVSHLMEQVVMKALEFEMENRFTSAKNLKKALLYIKQERFPDAGQNKNYNQNQAIELSKGKAMELSKAHAGIGITYAKEGVYERAREELLKAIEIDNENAELFVNLGYVYLMLKDYREALTWMSKAIALNPNLAVAYCNLGVIYNRLGKPEKAIIEFRKALQLNPNTVEAHINLAYIYGNSGKYREMLQECEKAMRIKPTCSEAYINYAYACGKLGHYQEGIAKLNNVVRINPNNPIAFSSLGVLYGETKEYEKGIEALNKALEIDPSLAEAHSNIGVLYYKQGNYQACKQSFKRAIEIAPSLNQAKANLTYFCKEQVTNHTEKEEILRLTGEISPSQPVEAVKAPLPAPQEENTPESCIKLGNNYMDKNMIDEGIREYQKAIKLDSGNIEAHYRVALAYMRKKLGILSENALRKVLKFAPDHFDAHVNLGILLFEKGDYKSAEEEYKLALNIKSDFIAYFNLGLTYRLGGKYDEALGAFNNALKEEPDSGETYFNMGFIYYEYKKDYERSHDYLTRAITKDFDYPDAHLYLGNIYYKKNMLQEAREEYTKVISLKPDYAIAYSNLGAVYTNLDKLEQAMDSYMKAIELDSAVPETHLNLGILYQKKRDYGKAIKEMKIYLVLTGGKDSKEVREVKQRISDMERQMRL